MCRCHVWVACPQRVAVEGPLFSRRTDHLPVLLVWELPCFFFGGRPGPAMLGLGGPSVGSIGLLYGVSCGCVCCVSTPKL